MRVFITGTGVVGCHAARDLTALGHEVALFDLSPRQDFIDRVAGRDVRVIRGDVRELPGVMAAVADVRPDVVIHTAALVGGQASALPWRGFEVNVLGTMHVAEAVRTLGVRRLVHTSTLGVFDRSAPQVAPLKETDQLGGNDRMYGTSKVACEQLLRAYSGSYKFQLAMLRFASVYGYGYAATGSAPTAAIHELLRDAIAGRPAVLGAGMPDVDELVYVEDLVRGVVTAVTQEALPHHTFNLGGGRLTTATEIVEAARRLFPGADITRPAGDGSGGGRAKIEQPMDISRARAELGYEVRFDLDAGLRDLAARIQQAEEATR